MNSLTGYSPPLVSFTVDYFLDLKLKNRSAEAIKICRWHIGFFLKYMAEESIEYPEQLSKEIIRQYQLKLLLEPGKRGRRRSIATVNRYMSSVKTFIQYLKLCGCCIDDADQGVIVAREPRILPKEILTREEMVELIEAPDISTVLGYRDRTIMELLYTTAIRRNECRNLKIPDVNFEEGLLRVFGKGQKERIVPIGRIALKFLDNYISSVRPILACKKSGIYLFLSAGEIRYPGM